MQNFIGLRSGAISIYAYDNASGTESVRLTVVGAEPDEDIPTGIQNINGLNNNDEVYGIDGRRMNQRNILNKGVYVINGKKVLVK